MRMNRTRAVGAFCLMMVLAGISVACGDEQDADLVIISVDQALLNETDEVDISLFLGDFRCLRLMDEIERLKNIQNCTASTDTFCRNRNLPWGVADYSTIFLEEGEWTITILALRAGEVIGVACRDSLVIEEGVETVVEIYVEPI